METALVAILAPFLGALLRGGEAAADQVGQRAGAEGWGAAVRIWDRLRGRVESSPAALESASDVGDLPHDARARVAFEHQLEKLLAAEPRFAEELARLLEDARESGSSGGDVHFHGDVRADRKSVVAGHVTGGIQTGSGGNR